MTITIERYNSRLSVTSGVGAIDVRYYYNSVTGQPHIYDHGITEEEVEEVLRGSGDDARGREKSRIKHGQTRTGRYLEVVYVPDEDDPRSLFVVTAYDMGAKAKRAFRRRRRRRGR